MARPSNHRIEFTPAKPGAGPRLRSAAHAERWAVSQLGVAMLRIGKWGLSPFSHDKWQYRKLYLIILVLSSCFSCAGTHRESELNSEVERRYATAEQRTQEAALITYQNASAPIGRFLLIRNGKDICAVRFTEFHRGRDKKPPTIFNSGEESLYAEYDWFYRGDGSGDFSKSDLKSGHNKLARKPLIGIGRFSMQFTGSTVVVCGPFKLGWKYPNQIGFHLSNSKKDDVGNELAPTRWKEIFEVDSDNPHLNWYRFNEDRDFVVIPLDELPPR